MTTQELIKERWPLLEALKEGKTLQFRGARNEGERRSEWSRWNDATVDDISEWLLHQFAALEWRVKPEPLERWICVAANGVEYLAKNPEQAEKAMSIYHTVRTVHMREV